MIYKSPLHLKLPGGAQRGLQKQNKTAQQEQVEDKTQALLSYLSATSATATSEGLHLTKGSGGDCGQTRLSSGGYMM